MQEYCYFSRSLDILVDLQFVIVNLLIFFGKQMHPALCFGSGSTNAVFQILLLLGPNHKHELLHSCLVYLC